MEALFSGYDVWCDVAGANDWCDDIGANQSALWTKEIANALFTHNGLNDSYTLSIAPCIVLDNWNAVVDWCIDANNSEIERALNECIDEDDVEVEINRDNYHEHCSYMGCFGNKCEFYNDTEECPCNNIRKRHNEINKSYYDDLNADITSGK